MQTTIVSSQPLPAALSENWECKIHLSVVLQAGHGGKQEVSF